MGCSRNTFPGDWTAKSYNKSSRSCQMMLLYKSQLGWVWYSLALHSCARLCFCVFAADPAPFFLTSACYGTSTALLFLWQHHMSPSPSPSNFTPLSQSPCWLIPRNTAEYSTWPTFSEDVCMHPRIPVMSHIPLLIIFWDVMCAWNVEKISYMTRVCSQKNLCVKVLTSTLPGPAVWSPAPSVHVSTPVAPEG